MIVINNSYCVMGNLYMLSVDFNFPGLDIFLLHLLLTCFFVRLFTFMGGHVCLEIVIKNKVVMEYMYIRHHIQCCSKDLNKFTHAIAISRQ